MTTGADSRNHLLDPLRLPLWGSRLIEASAGTGKTWTIAALYLRLVLGHGEAGDGETEAQAVGGGGREGTAYARPLLPSEILVMTFTKAATRELSDRIRQRLIEAAAVFRGERAVRRDDPLLGELLDAHAAGPARSMAAWRLAMAAESMDDAAVLTIDAWCQRMLREHAFDSGNLFEEELAPNEKDMQEESARDYWRQQIYPLSEPALQRALGVWGSVATLIGDVRQLMRHARPEHAGDVRLESLIETTDAARADAVGRLKAGWIDRIEELRAWLDVQVDRKDCPFNKRSLQKRFYHPWLDAIKAWAGDAHVSSLELPRTAYSRLTPAGMEEIRLPGRPVAETPLHVHFHAFERLVGELDALPDPDGPLRLHAAACVSARIDLLKRQAGTYGFQDLVDRLDAALRGANGAKLRDSVIAQFPVAMVDEFQDTSPAQYAIFDALYRAATNDPATALFLIGDPKQSIYAFRGADIESYMKARVATRGRHYVLGTNFRSSRELVAAVNDIFGHAERRHSAGAFMFESAGRARALPSGSALPFEEVVPQGRPDRFIAARGPVTALRLVFDSDPTAKRASQKRFAARCAEDIVRLLNDPEAGFQTVGSTLDAIPDAAADANRPSDPSVPGERVQPAGWQQKFQRLRPADLAVLVRDRHEAEAVRSALRARGVASVYLSDQESVFASDEARDLLYWLRAVEQPRDLRLVRAALATATIGLELAELAHLAVDDEAFEQRAEQVRRLHDVWLKQGVLTMLRQTLHVFAMPARWLAQVGGERRLTNFLHLAELIQSVSTRLDGELALIHWLRDQIDGDASTGDEQIVRLESDADLVQVITVHSSKGLEYPVVYLPFAAAYKRVTKRDRRFVALPDGDGGVVPVFGLSDSIIEAADDERLKEDLRLFYVALTRARHAVWVGVGAIVEGQGSKPGLHRSAPGYVLGGGEEIVAAELEQRLREAYGLSEHIALIDANVPAAPTPCTPLRATRVPAPLADAPDYTATFDKDWAVGSFSAMVRHIAHLPAGQVMSDVAREEELLSEPLEDDRGAMAEAADATPASAPWHRFPRGAMPGNFLHDQLEWLAAEGFALKDAPELRDQLQRRCERQGWGHRAADVVTWLSALCETPLADIGVSLAGLAGKAGC